MLMGLASSIASGVQGKRAQEAALAEHAKKEAWLDSMFNKDYYSDITKRTDIQNMLRIMQENQDKQTKRDEALSAITGSTQESQLAAQDSRNKSYASTLADIASNASSLKDAYKQNYIAQKMGLVNPEASLLQQSAESWSGAAGNLFKGGMNMLAGTDLGTTGSGASAGVASPQNTELDNWMKQGMIQQGK